MNTLPRRSARLSQLHQQQTSATSTTSTSSQFSSTTSTAFPSPADEFAQQQEQARLHLQAQFLSAPFQSYAPPSPSSTESNPFFGYLQTQQNINSMPQQSQPAAQQSHQQHGRSGSDKTQHHALEHHNSFSSQTRQNVQSGNDAAQLPPDFLAEAARRAQIACLMRDLGDVTL